MLRHPWFRPDRRQLLHRLSYAYLERWRARHEDADLDRAVALTRRMVDETTGEDWLVRADLGEQLHMRFQQHYYPDDLDEAIDSTRVAFQTTPGERSVFRARLAESLGRLLILRNRSDDLDEAINLLDAVVAVVEREHAKPEPSDADLLSDLLETIARAYLTAYGKTFADVDRQRAIAAGRRSLAVLPDDSPDRRNRLFRLGLLLGERLHEGVLVDEAAAVLDAAYDDGRPLGGDPAAVANVRLFGLILGYAVAERARIRSSPEDAVRAAELVRAALTGSTDDAPSFAFTGFMAAYSLEALLEFGGVTTLDEAISLATGALAACRASAVRPPQLAEFCTGLLAALLRRRAVQSGRESDLDAARHELRRAIGASDATPADFGLTALLGAVESDRRDWAAAADAYERAASLSRQMFRVQAVEEGRSRVLRARHDVPMLAAYARAMVGPLERAVLLMEEGRGVVLSEALSRDQVELASIAAAGRPDLADGYRAAVVRLRAVQAVTGDPMMEFGRVISVAALSRMSSPRSSQ